MNLKKIFSRYNYSFYCVCFFCFLFLASSVFAQNSPVAPGHGSAPRERPVFAKVNGFIIYLDEYNAFLQSEVRGKFYHGKPPEAELAPFQREIGQKIVDNVLRLNEIKKLKLEPDHELVNKQIAGYEKQYADSEQWQNNRERLLPGLRKKLESDTLLKVFEKKVRNVPDPSVSEVKAYFESHPEKFTEPGRVRVSAILLKVEPSSPASVWDAAYEEGKDILKRLKGGADFKTLAKIHSGDSSAENGGDMGYLHTGMLAEPVQEALDKLKIGELTDVLRILQGITILRLDDKTDPRRVDFESAKDRAKGLLRRELGDKAWVDLAVRLRSEADVYIDESYYLPMPEETTDGTNENNDVASEPAK